MARDLSTESWYKHAWRPTVAWVYLFICVFDFLIAPILTGVFFARYGGSYMAWHPITLEGGGLFHLAMGTILGITSYTRGKEMLEYAKSNNTDQIETAVAITSTQEEKTTEVEVIDQTSFRDKIINRDS